MPRNWLMLMALVAAPVVAQEQAPAEEEAAEEETAPAAEEKAAVPAPAAEPGAPTEGVYEVQPGDTLWNITQKELQNPWYWPKVWADNPDITNPNWIAPGTRLRIAAPGQELPAQVTPTEVAGAGEVPPEQTPDEAPPETEEVTPVYLEDEVSFAGQLYKPTAVASVRNDSFLTPQQLAEAGTIRASFEEKEMLALGDRIYIEFQDPNAARLGREYMVYRTLEKIIHPVTGAIVGYQTDVLGALRLEARQGTQFIGTVNQSLNVIERGDLVAPGSGEVTRAVARRANKKTLDGYIVASRVPRLETLGEQQMVFLDRGAADGVEVGNTFVVTRRGDGLGGITLAARSTSELPLENIAELLVIDIKERACSALVVNAIRELEPGDRVVMRPAQVAGAGGD